MQTCYEMERYLKDEPKLQSYKKLPTELDTAPWNLFRAPPISWTASTGTANAQFESPIKMEVSRRKPETTAKRISPKGLALSTFESLRACVWSHVSKSFLSFCLSLVPRAA